MNPLLMEDSLDDIFKKLTIEDLKTCRSVCQLWDFRASARLKKVWKDLKIINLFTEFSTQSFNRALFESKDKKIFTSFRGSVNLISNLGSKFISEHQPKLLDLRISSHDKDTKLEDLIDVLKLSSNYLVEIIIDDPINYRRIIGLTKNEGENWLDFNFQKLETINCNLVQSPHNAHICEQIINIIKEIAEKSPRLKSFENHGINVAICSSKIMSSDILQKLTKLTICFYKYNEVGFQNFQDCQDLIKMQNQGLKLKYLDIKYNVSNESGEGDEGGEIDKGIIQNDLWAIEKFLEGQSVSLETLKINVKYDYQIKFQAVFSKLKKLIMEIFQSSFKTQLNLSNQFPQLEVILLNIHCKKIVKWNKLFCGSSLKVHTLNLCNNGSDGEYRDLEMLFPHVVNLQIDHPRKNALKYEGFGNFWSKSMKSISIMTHQNLFTAFDLKFFKIFNGLQRIDFINQRGTVVKDSEYWKAGFELLKSFENLKFIKLDKLLVNQSDLTELRKKYIVDYIPGKLWNYAVIRLGIDLRKTIPLLE